MIQVTTERATNASEGSQLGRAINRKPSVTTRIVTKLRAIHLWLGIGLSPFILLIGVTGIAINHFGGGFLKHLHSGKAFGTLGRITVDLVAVGLITLMLTGIGLWIGPKIVKLRKRLMKKD